MLQQTQVSRVETKYKDFLQAFPTFKSLADAPIRNILSVWSGMGYNRRALYLKKIAEIIITKYKGSLPRDPTLLDELPGIGHATTHSIAVFAFNYPGIFIETNIRRVFIHFFFADKEKIDDREILPLVEKTLDKQNPREWYYALMDYGAMLASTHENANKKSKHYAVQSTFEGSGRQMRGAILKTLLEFGPLGHDQLYKKLRDDVRLEESLKSLQKEGFVIEKKGVYQIKHI
jgi:A/G-specific adenine glycosylase